MTDLEEELKKTSAGRKFLEEAEPEKQTDNLIEFAKEQCEIFPEDSYMGEYLRETIKMLQAEPCEDAVSRSQALKELEESAKHHANDSREEVLLRRDREIIRALPPVKPAACIAKVNFSKEDVIKAVDRHTFDTDDGLCLDEDISIILEELPPVKPTRKKGKWINKSHTSDCGIKFVASECTCCGKKTFFDCDQLVYNYCPNCGAEMRSEE